MVRMSISTLSINGMCTNDTWVAIVGHDKPNFEDHTFLSKLNSLSNFTSRQLQLRVATFALAVMLTRDLVFSWDYLAKYFSFLWSSVISLPLSQKWFKLIIIINFIFFLLAFNFHFSKKIVFTFPILSFSFLSTQASPCNNIIASFSILSWISMHLTIISHSWVAPFLNDCPINFS